MVEHNTLVHLSDLHLGYQHQTILFADTLSLCDLEYGSDVLYAVSGDLVEYGSEYEMKLVKSIANDRKILYVPGNHDRATFAKKPRRFNTMFEEFVTPYCYSFEKWVNGTDLHIIGLNSCSGIGRKREWARGKISNAQLRFLKNRGRTLHGIKVVMFHHHLFHIPKPSHFKWFLKLTNADEVMDIVFSHGYDIVLHGHEHVSANFFHFQNSSFNRNVLISCCALKEARSSHAITVIGSDLILQEILDGEIRHVKRIKDFFGKE